MKLVSILFGCLFLLYGAEGMGQNCEYSIRGRVIDEHDSSPLLFATVYVVELQRAVTADSTGKFVIGGICKGSYHLKINHLACEPHQLFVKISSDTTIDVRMEHHAAILGTIEVSGEAGVRSMQAEEVVTENQIKESVGNSLSEMVDNLPGVQSIKNGSGIAKPVIQGLYGNRIGIINNGILQEGQRWGNDHAPEIDPFVAKKIRVLKGADILEYGGGGVGGLILIEPGVIEADPHIHADIAARYQSNGRGGMAGIQTEKAGKWFNWRLTSSLSRSGDYHSPDYLLNNTGHYSRNASIQLEKSLSKKLKADLYYSFYNTNTGILRGAQIGNVNDLMLAINRDEPFYTEDAFSYDIEAPRQEVVHQLAKAEVKYFFSTSTFMRYEYGFQQDNRKEFDVRRGERSSIPSLALLLNSHSNKVSLTHSFLNNWRLKAGLQYQYRENENDPQTGILPLIPDYQASRTGIFSRLTFIKKRFQVESGIRVELLDYNVQYISRDIPREILRASPGFNLLSGLISMEYELKKNWRMTVNTGLIQRGPEINELFSYGLHQGVSGIEEGMPDLKPETSYKVTFNNSWSPIEGFTAILDLYQQYVEDYIYLQVEPELRQTIRGTFPVYTYRQTDAGISGMDLSLKNRFKNRAEALLNYSIVRGRDLSVNKPLVYMPSDRLRLDYSHPLITGKRIKEISLMLGGSYHWKQTRLDDDQDILTPPPAYYLVNTGLRLTTTVFKKELQFNIQVENLLNEGYRNYLNRLRYYSDEVGRNINFGLVCHL